MRTAPTKVHPSAAAVLAAVSRQRSPSVRTVARAAGLSVQRTYRWLLWWRQQGMVAWDPHKAGTLRTTFRAAHLDTRQETTA
ncbi:MAG: hypothetical protein ACRDXE_08160 [Acidimicrobiales bacterium]